MSEEVNEISINQSVDNLLEYEEKKIKKLIINNIYLQRILTI